MRTDASACLGMGDGRSRECGLLRNPSGAAFSGKPSTPMWLERRVLKARQSRERRVAYPQACSEKVPPATRASKQHRLQIPRQWSNPSGGDASKDASGFVR